MAHIYIYSPSGAVRDKAAYRRGIRRLEALGHQVEQDRDALSTFQRFAGDDEVRLAAIARAAASGADMVLPTRGGYGLTRLLPRLPYRDMAHAIAHGTLFVGLSDFTALQLALLAREGLETPTWAGNLLLADWGQAEEPDDITQACFEELLDGSSEGAGWYVTKRQEPEDELPALEAPVRDATLWGGNLCVLTSLLGTPYFPHVEGGVLFLEDVAEQPYRIERMLTQLLHAGVLDRQRAILLGQFTDYRRLPQDRGFGMPAVVRWLRTQTRTPIFTGLPHGHVPTKVMLPVGARVDFEVEGRDRLLMWGHSPFPSHDHDHDHDHDHAGRPAA